MANAVAMVHLCMRHQVGEREHSAITQTRNAERIDTIPEFSTPLDHGVEGVDRSNTIGIDDAVVTARQAQEAYGDA